MTTLEKNGCRRCWYGCMAVGESACDCDCHNPMWGELPKEVEKECCFECKDYEYVVKEQSVYCTHDSCSCHSLNTKTAEQLKAIETLANEIQRDMHRKTGDWETRIDYKLAEYPSLVPKQLVKDVIRETHRTLLTELIAKCEGIKENFNHIAQNDYYLGVRDGAEEALSDIKSLLENKRDGYDR